MSSRTQVFLTGFSTSREVIAPLLRKEKCKSATISVVRSGRPYVASCVRLLPYENATRVRTYLVAHRTSTKGNMAGVRYLSKALNGSSYSFEIGNDLRVPKLLTYEPRVIDNILAIVERIGLIHRQIRERKIDQSLFYRGCLIFAHVKDPVTGLEMSCRKDNRGCDVLDVSVGPPPVGMMSITMDGCKISISSTAVDLWQTNDCSRQCAIAENRSLHKYFVVVVELIFASIRFTTIRIKSGSQGRIFPQRAYFHRSRLQPREARIRKIDIPAADRHKAPCMSAKGLDRGVSIILVHRDHVNYRIGGEPEDLVGETARQARARIIPQVLHLFGKNCFGPPAMKHAYRMPRFCELARNMRANEAGAADYQNSHAERITRLLLFYSTLLPGRTATRAYSATKAARLPLR